MQTLTASLSASVANSARHFEELARRRLLRMGAESDLRAARTKIDALVPLTLSPACRYTAPESTNDEAGGEMLARSNDRDNIAHEKESTIKLGKCTRQAPNAQVQNVAPVKTRNEHGARHRSGAERGIVSPQGSRDSTGGRGILPIDTASVKKQVFQSKPEPKRKIPLVKGDKVGLVSPPNHCSGDAKSAARSTFNRAAKRHAVPDCRRPLATKAVTEKKRARSRPASTTAGIKGVVEQPSVTDAEGVLPRDAIEADLAEATDGNTPDQSPSLAVSIELSPEDEPGDKREHESPTVENPADSSSEQPLGAVSTSSEHIGIAVTTSTYVEAKTPDRVDEGTPKSYLSLPIPDKSNGGSAQGENGGGEVWDAAAGEIANVPVVVGYPRSVPKSPQRIIKGGRNMGPGAKHDSNPRAVGRNGKPDHTESPRTPLVRGSSAVCKSIGVKDQPRTTDDVVEQADGMNTATIPFTHVDVPQTDAAPVGDIAHTQDDHQPRVPNCGGEPGENPTNAFADTTPTCDDNEAQRSHAVATRKNARGAAGRHEQVSRGKLELGKRITKPNADVVRKRSTRTTGKRAKTTSPRLVQDAGVRTTAKANRTPNYGEFVRRNCRGERDNSAKTIPQEQGLVRRKEPHVRRELGSDIGIAVTKGPADNELENMPVGETVEMLGSEEIVGTEEHIDVADAPPPVESFVEIEQEIVSVHSACEWEAAADGREGKHVPRGRNGRIEGIDCEDAVFAESAERHHARGDGCLVGSEHVKSLRAEVDSLRSEKAELEDTIAHLNVAAAQIYLVEYAQMKVRAWASQSIQKVFANIRNAVERLPYKDCQRAQHAFPCVNYRVDIIRKNAASCGGSCSVLLQSRPTRLRVSRNLAKTSCIDSNLLASTSSDEGSGA